MACKVGSTSSRNLDSMKRYEYMVHAFAAWDFLIKSFQYSTHPCTSSEPSKVWMSNTR